MENGSVCRSKNSLLPKAMLCALCALGGIAVADVTVTVDEGDADRTLSAADVAGLGAADNLVKKGRGRLVISGGLFDASWSGAVKVDEGYLRVAHTGALGSAAARGAIVANGATLEIDGAALSDSDLLCGKIEFEGSGVDGESAVRVIGGNWTHKNVSWKLSGDATWGGASSKSEVFATGGSQSIDMNGHTLTLCGNGVMNSIHFYTSMPNLIVNPGSMVIDKGLYFVTENTSFPGGDEHSLTFKSSCQWRIANNARSVMTWRLAIEEGVSVQWACSTWADKWPKAERGWSGPVEIAKGATLAWHPGTDGSNPGGTLACTISGIVSGEGTIRCRDNYLVLDNPGNTIMNINNYQGCLYATSVSAVMPSFTNGTFTSSYLSSADGLGTFITVSPSGKDDAAAVMYYHAHYPAAFRAKESAGDPRISLIMDESASNGFAVGSYTLLEKTCYMIGSPYPEVARLTVEDGGVLDLGKPMSVNGAHGILLGRNSTNNTVASRGILRLENGGIISNGVYSVDDSTFSSGDSIYSQGTFVIDGGDYWVEYASGYWPYGMVGDHIGGCVLMRDGRWRSNNWVCFGHTSTGCATFDMTGGLFDHTANGGVGIGSHGGKAHMYIGGNAEAKFLRIDMPFIVWGQAGNTANARSALTIDGNAAVSMSNLNLGCGSNSVSIINLNGGVMLSPASLLNGAAITSSTQIQNNMASFRVADNRVYLNFNGGTLQFQGAGSEMAGNRITRMTVFGGGANFDLSLPSGGSGGGTLRKAFKSPTGKGVRAIPVPDVGAWEFTASPLIEIEGDGWGASAFAQFDENAGLITNIVVTSPGCDYTWAKAILRRGGRTQDTEIAITDCLADNDRSGGVRYCGDGTLTIASNAEQESDYRGATTISSGATVQYWSAGWHYPTNSPLVMDGGVCRFGNGGLTSDKLASVKLVGLSGFGTVHAAAVQTAALGFDAAEFIAGKTLDLALSGNIEIESGATVKIGNAELLAKRRTERFTILTTTGTIKCNGALKLDSDGALDDGWRIFVSDKRLRIGYGRLGTVVVVR